MHDKGVSLDNVDRMLLDQVAFDDAMMDDFQADAFMQNSCFPDGEKESPFSGLLPLISVRMNERYLVTRHSTRVIRFILR
jgi:hypothetical protein